MCYIVFIFAGTSPLTVKNEYIVEQGIPADFLCTANEPIRECSFKIYDETYSVTEYSDTNDFKYFGRSFREGDCGMTIKNITASRFDWYTNKCFVNTTNGRENLNGYISFIISSKKHNIF